MVNFNLFTKGAVAIFDSTCTKALTVDSTINMVYGRRAVEGDECRTGMVY